MIPVVRESYEDLGLALIAAPNTVVVIYVQYPHVLDSSLLYVTLKPHYV